MCSACRTTRNELGFRPFQHASMLTDYLKTPEKTRKMTSDYVPPLVEGDHANSALALRDVSCSALDLHPCAPMRPSQEKPPHQNKRLLVMGRPSRKNRGVNILGILDILGSHGSFCSPAPVRRYPGAELAGSAWARS